MPDALWNVLVTAEYEVAASEPFTPAMRVAEALRTGGMPWPVTLKIEVARDA